MTTPKCLCCGGPHKFSHSGQCMSLLAERVAALERWHPLQPWTPPADKAEALACKRWCGSAAADCPAEATVRLVTESNGFAYMRGFCSAPCRSAGRPLNPAPAVPKAEPARCEEWCGVPGASPLRPSYVSDVVWCSKACHEAQRPINPAPESTPELPGPTVKTEPRRSRRDEFYALVDAVGDLPTSILAVSCEPPRPEAPGPVSHDEARRAVNELRSFHGASTGPMPKEFALLDRYRNEREAAEKELADRISNLGSNLDSVFAEAQQLRAEVARLKESLRAAGSAGGSGQSEAVKR